MPYTIEIKVRDHPRLLNMAPFAIILSCMTSYQITYEFLWRLTVSMALSCIVSDIKRDLSKIAIFFIPSCMWHSRLGGPELHSVSCGEN